MALKKWTPEQLKERKAARNATYLAANRERLAAAKRESYAAGKGRALREGPDLRVQDIGLAHERALRVERNNRYRGKLSAREITRKKNQNRFNFSTPQKRYGQKWGGIRTENVLPDAENVA